MKYYLNGLFLFFLAGAYSAASELVPHDGQINEEHKHVAARRVLKVGESWRSADGGVLVLLLELNKSAFAKLQIKASKDGEAKIRLIKASEVPAVLLSQVVLVEIQSDHITVELHGG